VRPAGLEKGAHSDGVGAPSLIPAEAGIQMESTDTLLNLLGPRFRADERMGSSRMDRGRRCPDQRDWERE
jgi:hypothetical protein